MLFISIVFSALGVIHFCIIGHERRSLSVSSQLWKNNSLIPVWNFWVTSLLICSVNLMHSHNQDVEIILKQKWKTQRRSSLKLIRIISIWSKLNNITNDDGFMVKFFRRHMITCYIRRICLWICCNFVRLTIEKMHVSKLY